MKPSKEEITRMMIEKAAHIIGEAHWNDLLGDRMYSQINQDEELLKFVEAQQDRILITIRQIV